MKSDNKRVLIVGIITVIVSFSFLVVVAVELAKGAKLSAVQIFLIGTILLSLLMSIKEVISVLHIERLRKQKEILEGKRPIC